MTSITNHYLFQVHFFASFKTIPLRCCLSAVETTGEAGRPLLLSSVLKTLTVQLTSGVPGLTKGDGSGELLGELVEMRDKEGDLERVDFENNRSHGDGGSLVGSSFLSSMSPRGNLRKVHGASLSSSEQTEIFTGLLHCILFTDTGESTGVLANDFSSSL